MLSQSSEVVHPIHPHHLECPRCGRHAVVIQGDNHFVCIACGWWRDTTEHWNFPIPFIIVLIVLLLIL